MPLDIARRLCAALCGAVLSQAALADRSLEEPDVFEAGDCEVEAARERTSVRGAPIARESSIEFACGIGLRTELATAFARMHSSGESRERTIGLEARTSLRERSADRAGWTLVLGLGAERAGAGAWRSAQHLVAVEATFEPAPGWLLEARVGAGRDRIERRDRTLWTLAVERAFGEAIEARIEADGDDRERPLVGVALRVLVWPEHALLNLSYGARGGAARERRVGIGVTFEF